MALAEFPGTRAMSIGAGAVQSINALPSHTSVALDAVNEALIFIGQIATSDGGSHTVDTSGSSSLGWRSAGITFSSALTTVKVGLANADTAAGPPGRAENVADVITFNLSKSLIGGGGGITANAWQTHVPDAGTMTIANGDLVAFAVQMTARGGTDIVRVNYAATSPPGRPVVTAFLSAAYAAGGGVPLLFITFADGATGYFYGSDVASTQNARVWNSASATKEYGQLFNLPFPLKVYGIYGWLSATADMDFVLYSDPLSGSPVAEKTIALDANSVSLALDRKSMVMFSTPYSYAANTDIVAAFKPGSTNITAYYKTLASATHRISDPFGTSGYGVARATGAFANANVNLDHYYIGLLAGAFDDGASAGGGGGGFSAFVG